MLYGEYQCVPSTSCAPCWCRRSAMRWMTGQRVPSLRLVHTPMWTASACSPSIRSSFSSMPSSQMPFPCSSQPLQRKKACRNSSSSPYCAKVRVRSLKAVSYTHLDVYKRQFRHCPLTRPFILWFMLQPVLMTDIVIYTVLLISHPLPVQHDSI